MKAQEIQELIDCIAKSGLEEVNIEVEGFKLNIKRSNLTRQEIITIQPSTSATPSTAVLQAPIIQSPVAQVTTQTATQPIQTQPEPLSQPQPLEKEKKLVPIKSPMIGTFYRSPNPEAPPFVNVGDEVKVGQVVCIIEAMKLFNEIESEVSGRIVKVLVDNATPVEYDQPLFLVEPN
ncbi:MAG: acetyl-CoA carboxylase biotin carboxyl carrier protein [Microscillaceae bacterium]|nr:acetyl-CoA carboxylase biotin carboxyl carrier protein [Microscillaceae bacterium]MDW8460027.1 acetyl-CoA carboxylase biotin carboxyl carrier protein [Cytophagales bacterium]